MTTPSAPSVAEVRPHLAAGKRLVVGVVVAGLAVLLAATPAGRWLEEALGQNALFLLRGTRPPPAGVVVVSIDRSASDALGLPNVPRKWPRRLHARLIERLSAAGASVIALDIIFAEAREPEGDAALARAVAQAGNVVLFQYLHKQLIEVRSAGTELQLERLASPLPPLRRGAWGLAPFHLPKLPAQVNHFPVFSPELNHVPTLPAAVLQGHLAAAWPGFLALLERVDPALVRDLPPTAAALRAAPLHEVMARLRRALQSHPAARSELHAAPLPPGPDAERLAALVDLYTGAHGRYFNFYGAARSIRTLAYHEVLAGRVPAEDIAGRAVFVGFSERLQPEQQDAFYTVFSNPRSGLDVSGVELAATAFANLLEGSTLRVPPGGADALALAAWALAVALLVGWRPGLPGVALALAAGAAWAGGAQYAFTVHHLWLPAAIPLLVELPLAAGAVLLWSHREAQRERRNIRRVFGLHVPSRVVELAARDGQALQEGEEVHGLVLATDAQQFTALSERLSPAELHRFLNRYYDTLFRPIRAAGGIISDVVGDAALALWQAGDAGTRARACRAMLEVLEAVELFNRDSPHTLPIRMGLHCGTMVVGHVGGADHYEYRAVGDAVNTASRIEGANKHLGTRLLVSAEAAADLDGAVALRPVGRFRLRGKQAPVELFEVWSEQEVERRDAFAAALERFRQGEFAAATESLADYASRWGLDGPARFYLALAARWRQRPPEDWDGVVSLEPKP